LLQLKNMRTITRTLSIAAALLVFTGVSANRYNTIKTLPNKNTVVVQQNPAQEDSLNSLRKNFPVVYKKLIRQFMHVQNLSYAVKGNLLSVVFMHEKNKITLVLSKKGRRFYSIDNLDTGLPTAILEKIKAEYPSYAVFYKRKIRTKLEIIYQVIIEDSHEYKVIIFCGDEMLEQQQVKKAI
jgi:hypothetical protein